MNDLAPKCKLCGDRHWGMCRMDLTEIAAKAFCEAAGLYKWEDTKGLLRDWYLKGAQAILALPPAEAPWEHLQPSHPDAPPR